MKVYLYSTLSGKKELVKKPKGKPIRFFVCGPTVYDFSHIGHGRTYVFFDALVKYLRTIGLNVFYLQNITNIDDKIIRRAEEEKTDFKKIAKKYTLAHLKNMKALGVTAVDKYALATDYIPEIVKQVQKLIQKKHAYVIDNDGIYFDVATFKDYGKLSRRTTAQAEDGISRIDESVNKRNKGDFALWKFSKYEGGRTENERTLKISSGEPAWPSPWGWGRPGWHIEDTAITEHYFGPQYDLHGGANDLKFPHHEAEIAQQESVSGKKPFVKIWIHTGFLTLSGQKMSKSLGNFMTIDNFLKNFSPQVFRLLVLSAHYRSPIDYVQKMGNENRAKWLSVLEFLAKLKIIKSSRSSGSGVVKLAVFQKNFEEGLADDFNTPKALAALFSLMGDLNPRIWKLAPSEAKKCYAEATGALRTLGFRVEFPEVPRKITTLVRERDKLRRNQQFMQSDGLRKKINALGFLVEDTPMGSFVWPKV